MTDLSKAFDCLPPRLLISKLNAYGVDKTSCMLMANYFFNRKQRVKLSDIRSGWMEISKGSPQGCLMGPTAYNIHANDPLNDVKQKLESVSRIMFNWFDVNHMKPNPSKFQYIVFQHSSIDTVTNMINGGEQGSTT